MILITPNLCFKSLSCSKWLQSVLFRCLQIAQGTLVLHQICSPPSSSPVLVPFMQWHNHRLPVPHSGTSSISFGSFFSIISSSHLIPNPIHSASLLASTSASPSSFCCSPYGTSPLTQQLPERPHAGYSLLLSTTCTQLSDESFLKIPVKTPVVNAFHIKTKILILSKAPHAWLQPTFLIFTFLHSLRLQTPSRAPVG